MKLYLLIGQSNMAGRGHFGEVPPISDKRCVMLRNGLFRPMTEPICFDKSPWTKLHSGTCLAASFAVRCAEHFDEEIGLIPAAYGGSSLKQWEVGGLLYDYAVMLTKLAMRSGELAGILWHQGEAECSDLTRASSYAERFGTIIEQMQADLGVRVPLILGEMGYFLPKYGDGRARYHTVVNEQLHAYAAAHPLCAVASAEGLAPNEDNLHFSSAALRTFGDRYFEKYMELVK